MRVVLISYAYSPSVGGIETVSGLLVGALRQLNHEVVVITATDGSNDDKTVLRNPRAGQLVSALRHADAVIQSHVSLRLSWPLFSRIVRKPWMLVLHTDIVAPERSRPWVGALKRQTFPKQGTYAVSEDLARRVSPRVSVIPNPFNSSMFRSTAEKLPASELLFVGRLVPAKGLDILLRALANMTEPPWRLTVVGDGPCRPDYEALANELKIGDRVIFEGSLPGDEVAQRMANHSLIVIPSRRQPTEAFGVVALEAIASGCVPIASRHGGLPEAVGRHGILFEAEDIHSLQAALHRAFREPLEQYMKGSAVHTEAHTPIRVAQAYLTALEATRRPSRQLDAT